MTKTTYEIIESLLTDAYNSTMATSIHLDHQRGLQERFRVTDMNNLQMEESLEKLNQDEIRLQNALNELKEIGYDTL